MGRMDELVDGMSKAIDGTNELTDGTSGQTGRTSWQTGRMELMDGMVKAMSGAGRDGHICVIVRYNSWELGQWRSFLSKISRSEGG
jgi:X-X-X-Leu-X-X-Gly heptad repeat protein